jgi:putative ABC transport system permease protein
VSSTTTLLPLDASRRAASATVGVGNIMLIGVLERRSEIGLRRALGATKANIRGQFLAEAILLALLGGATGVTAGALSNRDLRANQTLDSGHPDHRLGRRPRPGVLNGAVAGLLAALRAAPHAPNRRTPNRMTSASRQRR